MTEQIAQPMNDGQPEAESSGAAARRGKLIKFPEDILALIVRNPASGIPNLEAQLISPAAGADDNSSAFGVAHRV